MVVMGFAPVSQRTEAVGFAASSFSIFDPRLHAPMHSNLSLCQTGEATI
jgi:hypothetical protein